ncbi:hypothetical protein ABK040_016505 [Willaertia magna]
MKASILLSLFLGLIAATYVSAACTSSWISANETTGLFSPNCPVGFYSVYSSGTYSCKQVTADMIGQSCTFNADCKLSWLSCVSGKCAVKQTRFKYESCSTIENCGAENYESLNCVTSGSVSECKTYSKVYRAENETCGTVNNENNQMFVCGSNMQCVSGICRRVEKVAVGKACGGLINNVVNECDSGARCALNSNATYTCVKATAQGQDCSFSYECAEKLICRHASSTATKLTCEKKSFLNENCKVDSDCYTSEYGTGVIDVVIYVANNSRQCYSGYCDSVENVHNSHSKKTACSVGNGCNNNPAACVCGGKATTVEDGVCAASCQGRAYDVYACAWNAGVTSDTSSFVQNFFDNKSKVFNSCKNELQNYYKCMKGSMGTAGVTGTVDTLPNLEFKGDASTDENPIMPKYNSASSIVASFALILMIFAAMFAL